MGSAVAAVALFADDVQADTTARRATFVNPLYPGADPWIARKDGFYYLVHSTGGSSIAVWKSDRLTNRGQRAVVWRAPRFAWNSTMVWAPELHYLRGKWYIYYAAAARSDNATHRMGVLEAETDDPQGPYKDRGMLYTGDDIEHRRNNRWAIDGTVLEVNNRLYFLWSGWEDHRDLQYLYIARMENPWTIASDRVKLCPNDTHLWERVSESRSQRGLHEGPVALVRNGKIFLTYSCSGSWETTYKLGMLHADEKSDPMDPRSWTKLPDPVFQSTRDVFGVGHCCFTRSPDDSEDWMLYHAKNSRADGWSRTVRMQKFTWKPDGFPDFGQPVQTGQELTAPSGEQDRGINAMGL